MLQFGAMTLNSMRDEKGRFVKGIIPWSKGIKLSDEHISKLKKSHTGNKLSEGAKEKLSKFWTGKKRKPFTDEHKENLSKSHIGNKLSEEAKEKLRTANSGSNTHLWKGGITNTPYSIDWTNTLRQAIRERDHYQCQMCGEKQGDIALSVHHIDYNKKNCDTNNLISLCVSCHAKTNSNRDYWLNFFNK